MLYTAEHLAVTNVATKMSSGGSHISAVLSSVVNRALL